MSAPTLPDLHSTRPFEGGGRAIALALAVSLLGWLGLWLGQSADPREALFSYLIAHVYALTLALGLLFFALAAHAMNAAWPTLVRRLAEAGFSVLPLLAVLFVPILLGLDRLYPWAHPERVQPASARALLEHKLGWLGDEPVTLRALVYFAVFLLVGRLLRAGSLAMESDPDAAPAHRRRLRAASAVALPLVGLAATFAAFDWVMALSPDWYSTMLGLYVLAGGFVGALGLLAVLTWLARGRLFGLGTSHWYALGRLLFAFLVFWAYLAYFQFMLSWIANKPIEARWYLQRTAGPYRWVSAFLVWGHFALPFVAGLSYVLKRRAATVAALGAWLCAAHYLDVHWLIAPARGTRSGFSWLDLAALAAVLGPCVAFALLRQRGRLLQPIADPTFAAACRYQSR